MIRRRVFLLGSAVLIVASAAIAQSDFNYGEVWQGWDSGARLNWVWGAAEGQSLIIEELPDESKEFENRLPSDSADVIAEIMTQYYEDAANTYIPWKYMALVARRKLEGESEAELTERLEDLREYAVWLRQQ